MRTLGASLVAIAAIAASFSFARQRPEPRGSLPRPADPDASLTTGTLNLDGIRAAGL